MKIPERTPRIPAREADGLTGNVKQMMQVCRRAHYKAGLVIEGKMELEYTGSTKNFIRFYRENGHKAKEVLYGTEGRRENICNETGDEIESLYYRPDGKLYQKTICTYDEKGRLLVYDSRHFEPDFINITHHKYDEYGRSLENVSYSDDNGTVRDSTVWVYKEDGEYADLISCIKRDGKGNMEYETINTYNAAGQKIEYISRYAAERMKDYNRRWTYKYNDHGDCVQTNHYSLDGVLKDTFVHEYQYDSEGKKIIPPRPPMNEKASGETEECEYDANGNWIKKTTYYNKIPVHVFHREIAYYGDPAERTFTHPLAEVNTLEKVVMAPDAEEELSMEDAQWLVETPNSTPDNFSALRYYVHQYHSIPSGVTYTGPYIEALTLMKELKENMGAKEIHSYGTVWNAGGEILQRYTLIFPRCPGYMLHAFGIHSEDIDEFEVPGNIDYMHDGCIYISQFQLLRPSEASGHRDDYFEEELNEYIAKCSLKKKPEKPVINMIEVTNDGFTMREHAVDDDFEIRDLNINYGYGFEQFHNELMNRFHTSTKGLILFHGQPGTGKTYYIRHLLRKMVAHNKVVIYMPPNMVDHLVEPAFMTFLTHEVQHWSHDGNFCVLLIEDAEPLLAKRQQGIRIQGITNLLNMSDGLLNDMLNLQIICTFNVDLKKLDSALLRPGRLVARKEFKALSELDANLLAQRLGIKHHFTAPATLGEIYAMQSHKNILIHDVEPDKDASELIDDLL